MGLGRPPKVRELIHALRRQGCAPIRQKGSHEIWKTPTGGTFTIVVNHPNDVVSRCVLKNVSQVVGESLLASF